MPDPFISHPPKGVCFNAEVVVLACFFSLGDDAFTVCPESSAGVNHDQFGIIHICQVVNTISLPLLDT